MFIYYLMFQNVQHDQLLCVRVCVYICVCTYVCMCVRRLACMHDDMITIAFYLCHYSLVVVMVVVVVVVVIYVYVCINLAITTICMLYVYESNQ